MTGPLSLDILGADDRARYEADLDEWRAMVRQFGDDLLWRDRMSFERAWLVQHLRHQRPVAST